MNKIQAVKSALSKKAGRTGLILKKKSPELLMATGLLGFAGTVVLACKATLKAEEVIAEAEEKIDKIKYVHENTIEVSDGEGGTKVAEYTEADYRKDMGIVYIQTSGKFLKLYGPAITMGILSIFCILSSQNIMKKRNVALTAAYKAIEQGFSEYRSRVVEEYGEDVDRDFKNGIRRETVTVTEEDENGKKKKVKKVVETVDPNGHSIYARFFDESNPNWTKTPEYNLLFLKNQQNWANDKLHAQGHLFLNEVYDMLDMDRSQAGAVVGWVVSQDGDNFVDFGIYDMEREASRAFVNGYERSILLDFNVDGVIYDLI